MPCHSVTVTSTHVAEPQKPVNGNGFHCDKLKCRRTGTSAVTKYVAEPVEMKYWSSYPIDGDTRRPMRRANGFAVAAGDAPAGSGCERALTEKPVELAPRDF
jgi:hypothetical protein